MAPRDAPLIFGHRGAPRSRRENTLASFDQALSAGVDGVEFDLRRTADDIVLHHDVTVRLRGRRHVLRSLPRSRLPKHVCSLDEIAAWARANKALLDVEIKEAGFEDKIVARFRPMLARCVFTSFLPDVMFRMRELAPRAKTGWITKAEPDAIEAVVVELRPSLVVLPMRRCSAALVASLRRLEADVWAWNVNTARAAERLTALGIGGLITDEPARLCAWRDGRAQPRTVPRKDRRES